MVHPIRPVGCLSVSCRVPYVGGFHTLVRGANLWAGRTDPSGPHLAAILRGKALGLDRFCGLLGIKMMAADSLTSPRDVAEYSDGPIASLEPWQPWPAHPPFIDEVHRWWPSQDWPPPDPPIIIEETVNSGPPYLILWQSPGRLVDLWA